MMFKYIFFPKISRYSLAFCSMIDKYGITTITLRKLCFLACASANAIDESVLPPPVGTVNEKKPCGDFSLLLRHASKMPLRNSLIAAFLAVALFSHVLPVIFAINYEVQTVLLFSSIANQIAVAFPTLLSSTDQRQRVKKISYESKFHSDILLLVSHHPKIPP